MTFDEQLRRAFDGVADRLRDEVVRSAQATAQELVDSARADRDAAIAGVREQAEREVAARLSEAEAAALELGREAGFEEGKASGRLEVEFEMPQRIAAAEQVAREAGRQEGLAQGRGEGHDAGLAEGREQGRQAGFDEGHQQGRQVGLDEGRTAGRDEARAEAERELAERLAAVEATALERGRAEGHETALAQARLDADAAEALVAEKVAAAVAAAETAAAERHDAIRKAAYDEGREAGRLDAILEAPVPALVGAAPVDDQADARFAAAEARAAAQMAAHQRLAKAVQSIAGAQSLTDVLDSLLVHAEREASRVAILLVQGRRFRGWRFYGFGPTFDPSRADFADVEVGIVADAFHQSRTVVSGEGTRPPAFSSLTPVQPAVAVPLLLGGEVAAVLYADRGASAAPIVALPADNTGEVVPMAWCSTIEALTTFAASRVEALVALAASRLPADAAEPSGGAGQPRPPAGDLLGEDDTAAKRYARLLVSEIKLYHESDVVAGRQARDLSLRLGGEIARARAMYEQRVPPHIRGHQDHFHAELVRTLANGDASLLEVTA